MSRADSEAVDLSQVRFYVDENLAGLGSTLRKVRAHLDPAGAKNPRVWDFLRLLLRHWDDVEALCSRTGPVWLQLDGRARPWERDYQPGKPPRLLSDPRAARTRVTRVKRPP